MYLGAPNYSKLYDSTTKTVDTILFYQAERGTKTGKVCTSGTSCNDSVIRTTTWTGYVVLSYITAFAYASSESVCETNMQKYNSCYYICKNNNWMHRSSGWTWYLSPYSRSIDAHGVWHLLGGGVAYSNNAIYLKSNVLIESSIGTESNPYTLSIQ